MGDRRSLWTGLCALCVLLSLSCIGPASEPCGDGTFCPAHTRCAGSVCVVDAEACEFFSDGAPCGGASGLLCIAGECVASSCGDGFERAGEACDDGKGNSQEPDARCRLDCTLKRCGDGVLDGREQCDLGAVNDDLTPGAMCRSACAAPSCGDGILDPDEGGGCFYVGPSFRVGKASWRMALADFDGDGVSDVVTSDLAQPSLSILYGREDTLFDMPKVAELRAAAQGIASAELDADPTPELAFVSPSEGVLGFLDFVGRDAVLKDATFDPGLLGAIASGDTDRDGIDELWGLHEDGALCSHVRNANGAFEHEQCLTAPFVPTEVTVADLERDGDLDLIMSDLGGALGLRVWRNEPSGFVLSDELLPDARIANLRVGVLTRGALPAIIAVDATRDALVALQVLNDGSFAEPVLTNVVLDSAANGLATLEIAGDSHLDLVIASGRGAVALYMGQGTGAFSRGATIGVDDLPSMMESLDVNRDGRADVLELGGKGVLTVLPGGDGTLGAPRSVDLDRPTARASFVAKAQGMRAARVFLARAPSGVSVFVRQRDALVLETEIADVVATSLAALDLDRDDDLDLVVGTRGAIEIHRREQDGQYARIQQIPDWSGSRLTLGDTNNDGRLDIVADSWSSLWILEQRADGTFSSPNELSAWQMTFRSAFVRDMTGDDLSDIVIVGPNERLSVLRGEVGGGFSRVMDRRMPAGDQLSPADLDGDGVTDVVLGWPTLGRVTLLRNDGTGKLSLLETIDFGDLLSDVRTADFNGDGHVDIAAAPSRGNLVEVRLGRGDGTFVAGQRFTNVETPLLCGAEDLDGDAVDDLILLTYDGTKLTTMRGTRSTGIGR